MTGKNKANNIFGVHQKSNALFVVQTIIIDLTTLLSMQNAQCKQ